MSNKGDSPLQEREATVEASSELYDVAIIGGGIAGLTLALQLKKSHAVARILVVEKQQHPVPEAAHKVGESTVEIAGHYLRDVLGFEEHLQTQQLNKFGLRFFFSVDGNQDITHRVELGHAVNPPCSVQTYQIDRGRLENALGREQTKQGIAFLDGGKVQQVDLRPQEKYHRLRVLHGGSEREVQARWVVDASGRSSLLKRKLGLAKKVDHYVNAAWFRIAYPIDINEWSTDPNWQARIVEGERRLSTNHLMGPGYWVWLIPLASDSISIGIVADAQMHPFEEMNTFERALAWLYQHEPQCAHVVEQHRADMLDFRVLKDYSYGCQQVYSDERWCLTGEAGAFLDPFYSPGSDMIAISNGLICDLISSELAGEEIEDRAASHNQLYLLLYNSWLGTYEGQYPIMGNAQVMTAKIIWDTTAYWAVPALLYYHDSFRTFTDSPGIAMNLLRFSLLSDHVQAFFRQWHAIDQPAAADTFVRYYDYDFMTKLHTAITAGLADDELEAQFAANIHFLEQLAGQLVSTVIEELAHHGQNKAVQSQVQHWKADTFLTELVALYQQENRTNPINGSWIVLGRQRQEVVR